MVHDEVWLAAWPTYPEERRALIRANKGVPGARTHLLLCFDCLSKRLGRPLRIADFDLDVPINAGIRLGIVLGRWSAYRE
jgi:hypothetical protein